MENKQVLYELGVDAEHEFSFVDGDFVLITYEDNLRQAIVNRLNVDLNELDLFYTDYGSVLSSFFGWKRTEETLNYIKTEVETVLADENRLNDFTVDANFEENGTVSIHLDLIPKQSETNMPLSLIINDNGEIIDENEV